MTELTLSTQSPLLDRFNAFYREILAVKNTIQEREAMAGALSPPPEEIALRLSQALDRQAASLRGIPLSGRQLQEAQYAMVALADETILNLEWPGRSPWLDNPLEARRYQSHEAGERLFQKIDALLYRNDPDEVELARVYLMTLALDFKGRYRGLDPHDERAGYLTNLHYFIFKRDPAFSDASALLFPNAYQATLNKSEPAKFPRRGRLVIAGLVLILAFMSFTHFMWLDLTMPLAQVVDQILELQSQKAE